MNFIFSNINIIALAVWLLFFAIVVVRTFPHRNCLWKINVWCNVVPFTYFIVAAVSLHIFYGAFLTWGQYVVWKGSEFTKIFLSSPLPKEVPFPTYLEFVHPLFNNAHGYFAFYAFEHFFLSTIALLLITGLFALFFKTYAHYRPSLFQEGDIAVITLAFLITGWPGVIVLIPLGFVLAILFALLFILEPSLSGTKQVSLPIAFLIATPIALIFSTKILTALNLYTIFKL